MFAVYGWEEPEFQAVESEEPYLLSIGVTKGSLALEEGLVIEQTFSVQHTGGTASKHSIIVPTNLWCYIL